MKSILIGLLAAPILSLPLAAQTVQTGFELHNLPSYPTSPWEVLSNGNAVTFDGQTVALVDALGNPVQTLHTFPASNFTGIFNVDPTESFVVVGESTNGDVYRVDLGGAGATFLTNLVFNYDATFAPDGNLYVSAATGGFSMGNDLVRLDPLTGATTFVAHTGGASGPVATDPAGNLYYGFASDAWPTPPDSSYVMIFPAATLAGADCGVPGGCLDETDAISYSTGYDGSSDMVLDPATGAIYMAENNFFTGTSRIWRISQGAINPTQAFVDEVNGNWTSNLQILNGPDPATLQAYQPAGVDSLVYSSSGARRSVTGRRPYLFANGPGTTGAGQVDLGLNSGAPLGIALLFFGPTANLAPSEVALPIANPAPLISGLDLATAQYGALMALDATGAGSLSFQNPGLIGVISIQGVVVSPNGVSLLGTSTRVDL